MQIPLKNRAMKITTMTIGVAVFILLSVCIVRAYFATLIAETPTAKNLQTSTRLDPSDAEYALNLGRLYQYSVIEARPDLAIQELSRSVHLNAYDPQAWLDLGKAYEYRGDTSRAAACMHRASALAPNIPTYQWAIGNFFLLHDQVDEAFRHFKMVLAADRDQGPIYNTAWKASGDASKILAELIPESSYSELQYLNYLVGTHRVDDAQAVWDRIAKSPEKFSASSVSPYLDALIIGQKPKLAYQVWTALREKSLIPATYEALPQNLVENGDFENQLLNMGFDWRSVPVNGIYVGYDDSTFHSPGHSLLIQFPGTTNYDYHQFYQFVPVDPGRVYRLQAFMKTEGITTDSGPRIEVRDSYDSRLLDKYTGSMTGTSSSWVPVSLDFKTSRKTRLVDIFITRPPSEHFDNQIAGKVWVDDVSLTLASNGGVVAN